jgi:prophage antirepressor-like protein
MKHFNFNEYEIRVVARDGEPWFVLADVCRVLEIANPRDAATRLRDRERNTVALTDAIRRGNPNVTIINESGLYRLIIRSDKPEAERFQDWVVEEVLPMIRKTGGYITEDKLEALMENPFELRRWLGVYAEKVVELKEQLAETKPKVNFYDRFAEADGLFTLQNAGRALDLPPNRFVNWLKTSFLFYQDGKLMPYSQFKRQGIFAVKLHRNTYGQAFPQTFITPKGITYFGNILLSEAARKAVA